MRPTRGAGSGGAGASRQHPTEMASWARAQPPTRQHCHAEPLRPQMPQPRPEKTEERSAPTTSRPPEATDQTTSPGARPRRPARRPRPPVTPAPPAARRRLTANGAAVPPGAAAADRAAAASTTRRAPRSGTHATACYSAGSSEGAPRAPAPRKARRRRRPAAGSSFRGGSDRTCTSQSGYSHDSDDDSDFWDGLGPLPLAEADLAMAAGFELDRPMDRAMGPWDSVAGTRWT